MDTVLLPDKVNTFFVRFEDNTVPQLRPPDSMCRPAGWCVYRHIKSLPIPVYCPHMLQDGTIVPVPKKAKITDLNDYHTMELTSVIMKFLER
jgi:hypothetical protein